MYLQKHLLTFCLLLACGSASALEDSRALVFGVVPQQTTDKLLKSWQPVMDHLRKTLKRPVRFATAPSISEFEMRSEHGDYDIVYMNPYHYIHLAEKPGFRAIANQSHTRLKGIIVVPIDSAYKSWHDLKGLTLHLPSPNSFAASLLVQAELHARQIDYQPHYVGSHDTVYRNVALHIAHAGGGISRTLTAQPDKIKQHLRVLGITHGYTPHAFAVHPRISAELRIKLTQALLSLPPTVLANLHFKPLQAANDSDYDDIRALGLDQLTIARP